MIWFPALPNLPRLLSLMAAIVASLSVPILAGAQLAGPQSAQSVVGTPDAPAVSNAPPFNKNRKQAKSCPQTVEAETMTGSPDRVMNLYNDVEVSQCDTTIDADKAIYHVVEDQIEAYGHVRMTRFGDLYTGDELILKMDTGFGYMLDPTYHLVSNNAQGQAKRIDFIAEDRANVINGSYSTCESPDPDWYLKSTTMDIDRGRDTGTASHAIVYFEDWPILWVPQMGFPLSDARKSGFLAPTVGGSNRGGLVVETPYYFNIAPNRDLTLFPDIITERGLQLGADMRYLEPAYYGETKLEILSHDKATDTDRWAISSMHTETLAPGWGLSWNVNAASDDNYPNDFPRSITTASQRLLGRDLTLTYTQPFWSAALHVSGYQVLQDPLAPIVQPYDRLPQLTLHAGRQDVDGFDWSVDAEAVRFWQPDAVVEGDRYTMTPRLSYPIIAPFGFFTPKISVNFTKYDLQDQAAGTPSGISRAVPTVSLDSGLIFEKDLNFFGQGLIQTLEPRLFYVWTPYRNQSLIPNFDSADADISYSQLFSENRFVGGDRIGDANQLTVAAITRFMQSTGEELARFAIGQRFSFSTELVTLPGDPPSATSSSDLLFSSMGRFSKMLSGSADLDYSESAHGLNQANIVVRWQPGPKKLLNLEYLRDVPNAIQQYGTSGQWPILQRWYAVGRVDYSLLDHKIVQGLIGIEYKADCWVFRFGGQHTQTATDISSTSSFFQLELNGLTQLGSNALEAMRLNVPGYQAINQAAKPSYP
jgi:LPS-assembly protein